jgi:hypothetical protein
MKGQSLVNILSILPRRRCRLRRDRVYSVLSLANEGPNITVDYGSSDLAVYSQILQVCEKSVCICSTGVTARDLVWESLSDSPLEEEATKPIMYTSVTPQEFRRKKGDDDVCVPPLHKCITCNLSTPSAWQPGQGHLFCLRHICSTIRGGDDYVYHLYLSTTAPTQRKVFSTRFRKDRLTEEINLRDDVSIEDVADSNLFRIGFDALGDFCKELFQSHEGYPYPLETVSSPYGKSSMTRIS